MIDWIKAEWVTELRNPARTQGTGLMRDGEGRQCCLGVLCDIAVNHGVISPPSLGTDILYYRYDGCGFFLSYKVTEWAGMTYNPSVPYNGHQESLTFLNDVKRLTFPQIADLIEEHL